MPLLVVPNQSLKDNHQEELANELQRQGYVVATSVEYAPFRSMFTQGSPGIACSLFSRQIPSAIGRVEDLRAQMLTWPPVRSADRKQPRTLEQVMADEMGFLD